MYLHTQLLINEIAVDEPDPAAANALQGVRRRLPADASITVQLFSALAGQGVAQARAALEALLDGRPIKETPAGPADPAGVNKPGIGG